MIKKLARKGIRFKIILSIVSCSIFVALLIGGVILFSSRSIVGQQSNENLLLNAQNKANEFNITIQGVENAVSDLAVSISANTNVADLKSNMPTYESNIQPLVKHFGEETEGNMSVYFYFNPELTGEVHGAWFADKQNNGTFEAQNLGTIDEFAPDNEDLNWYYKPVGAKKGLWLDPYTDEDLSIQMISYVMPIYQNDVLLGVVGMDINFDYFKKGISEAAYYQTGYAYLLNESGNILIHKALKQGDKLSETENGIYKQMADNITANSSGMASYSANSAKYSYAFTKLSNGFHLVVDVPDKEIYEQMNHLTFLSFCLMLIGVLVAVIIAYIVGQLLSSPLKKATIAIDQVALLHLNTDSSLGPLMKRKDEIGTMAVSIHNMKELLRKIVDELKQAASNTYEYADNFVTSANEASGSMQTVSSAMEQLTEGVSNQSSLTENGLQNLRDLSKELDRILENSEFVNSSINETHMLGNNAIQTILNLQNQLEAENAISNEIASYISLLAEKSVSIGEIITTISYIADQTGLLSLNASIEAARAGEQGKGFAVVAKEIQNLSDQTALSAKNIEQMIQEIQNEIELAKSKLDESDTIKNQSDQALEMTNEAFSKISQSLDESFERTTELISSIDKVSHQKNEVVQNIEQISDIIQESAAFSEEVAASMEQQLTNSETILQTSENLKGLVTKLNEISKEFKVD